MPHCHPQTNQCNPKYGQCSRFRHPESCRDIVLKSGAWRAVRWWTDEPIQRPVRISVAAVGGDLIEQCLCGRADCRCAASPLETSARQVEIGVEEDVPQSDLERRS